MSVAGANPEQARSVTARSADHVTGVVLAGGRAQRMGGRDKGLVEIDGVAMVQRVIERLEPQVGTVIINANRNLDRYARLGYDVVRDGLDGYLGPLAGMLRALEVARTRYVVTVPCDSPFLPDDLVPRLLDGLSSEAVIAVAHDGERMQPVFCLLRTDLLDSLRAYLDAGQRKIDRWFAQHRVAAVDFADVPETFVNVNTPEERAAVEARWQRTGP